MSLITSFLISEANVSGSGNIENREFINYKH